MLSERSRNGPALTLSRVRPEIALWSCAALLLLFRCILVFPFDQPALFADEAGYLGNARYFSGGGITWMITTTFYNFGYSLLLIPAQWLNDPASTYRAALLVNCVASGVFFLVLFRLLRLALNLEDREALVVALVASLYPACSYWPYFAMSETMCTLVVPCAAWLLARYLRQSLLSDLIGFCAVCAFSFTLHGRFALLPVLACLTLAMLRRRRLIRWAHVLYGTALIAGIIGITVLVNGHLQRLMWTPGSQGTFGALLQGALTEAQKPQGGKRFALIAIGQIGYLTIATYGLLPFALVFILNRVWRLRIRRNRMDSGKDDATVLVFIVAASISVFATSAAVIFRISPILSTVALLNGRLVDSIAPLLLAIALASYTRTISDSRPDWSAIRVRIFTIGVSLLGIATVLLAFASPEINVGIAVHETIGINHSSVLFRTFNYGSVTLLSLGAAFLIDFCLRRKRLIGFALLTALFIVTSIGNYRTRIAEQSWQKARAETITAGLKDVNAKAISLDVSSFEPSIFFGLQYLSRDLSKDIFSSAANEAPRQNLVIAGPHWAKQFDPDARPVAATPWASNPPNLLWIRRYHPRYAQYASVTEPPLVIYPAVSPGRTGRITGLSRIADPSDKPDFLVFAQYIPVKPGMYSLNVDYLVWNVTGKVPAYWDVVLGAKTVAARGQLAEGTGRHSSRILFSVTPELDNSVFEFRVAYTGAGTIRLDKIDVRPYCRR